MADLVYNGNSAAPTAATAVVTSATLSSGLYSAWVSVHLEGSGTPAAADLDNIGLYVGTTKVSALPVAEAKSVLFTSPEIQVYVPPAGAALTVQAVGNATASVTYAVTLIVRSV